MRLPRLCLPARAFGRLLALCLLSAACSSTEQPKTPPAPPRPVAPLHQGPLSDYVPAPSLRWLVLAQPRAIAQTPGLLDLLAPLVKGEAFDAFAERNGFDLRTLPSALVAGFELGTLYVVPAEGQGDMIAARFQERLLDSGKVQKPHPHITRISGIAGTTPESMLRAKDQLVALAVDDPTLVRLVEGYLLERFRKTPVALRGAALAPLESFAKDAPLRVFFPGPFDERDVPGPLRSSLLAASTAAAAAVSFRESTTGGPLELQLHIALLGDFTQDPEASTRLRDVWAAISESAALRWFGLNRPLSPIAVTQSADRLELTGSYDAELLMKALYGAARAELTELFPLSDAHDPHRPEKDAHDSTPSRVPLPNERGSETSSSPH